MVLNENQTLLGRCYFTLNRHATDALSVSIEEQTELFDFLRDAKTALDGRFSPDHYNYVMLMNVDPHVHAHIIPRYGSERTFAGETFVDGLLGDHYDPAAVRTLTDEQFAQLTAVVTAAMPDRSET